MTRQQAPAQARRRHDAAPAVPARPTCGSTRTSPVDASVNVNWYIEQARLAEEARFDLIFIVDSQFITADSPPHYLNRLEPVTLLSALAVSTTPPRPRRHHDHLLQRPVQRRPPPGLAGADLRRPVWLERGHQRRRGRGGNFSREEHFDYDTRYARGLEFVRVAQGLWDSYEDDAFPRDRATRTFLDASGSTPLNHRGEHFQVAGPLNVSRSPQGQPVIFGGRLRSGPRPGRDDRRGHLHPRAVARGGPGLLPRYQGPRRRQGPRPGRHRRHAGPVGLRRRHRRRGPGDRRDIQRRDKGFDRALAELGRPFAWHDFRQYDLDAPFPQEALVHAERGFRTNAESIARLAQEKNFTLRQTVDSSPRRGRPRWRLRRRPWRA